jgi:hypothetical protein
VPPVSNAFSSGFVLVFKKGKEATAAFLLSLSLESCYLHAENWKETGRFVDVFSAFCQKY